MPSRRGVLTLIGGGVVLAAAAGAGGFYLASQPSQKARAAWREAGTPEGRRERFLSYALLAPNPHNRQPWRVRLDGEDGLTLFCDLDRRLPETDPFDRQITIGCGAFLEVLSLAAAAEGVSMEAVAFPDGEPQPRLDARPVASVRFTDTGRAKDPLFDHVLTRVTNREPNTKRMPDPADIDLVLRAGTAEGVACSGAMGAAEVAQMRDLAWRGFERESLTASAHGESVNLMRIGKAEVETHRDGICLDGPMMEALKVAGLASRESMRDPESAGFAQMLSMMKGGAMSAPAFVWQTTAGNSRAEQIAAGRAYARLTLAIAERGLSVQPYSQALQEYAEMADLYEEAQSLLGDGRVVQMFVRVGYAPPVARAPRRGLSEHLTT